MKEGRAIGSTEHPPPPAGTAGRAVPILLVQDNPGDVRLTREALRGCGITNPIDVVTDGAAALAYLHRAPPYHDAPRPGLVLLDLNLPRADGGQVLTVIKTDPDLRTIPVIILSTSADATDVEVAYRRHVNCYIVKPPTFAEFAHAISGIGGFWLDLVTLPPAAAAVGRMTPEPTPAAGPEPVAGVGRESAATHPAAPHLLRILLLEDNPTDARLTLEQLRGSAIDWDVATQLGEVSAQRLAAVDCALIDLGLPDASGLQALQRIRDLAPELSIVVLTGFADEVTGPLALRMGAQDYLIKQDSDGYAIVRAIRFAVARKRLQLALDHEALHKLELTNDVIQELVYPPHGLDAHDPRD